jgi:hypothetical protein
MTAKLDDMLQRSASAPERRINGLETLAISRSLAYMHCSNAALHTGVTEMIAKIRALLDALFAPLGRELARMPASAFRHLLPGF